MFGAVGGDLFCDFGNECPQNIDLAPSNEVKGGAHVNRCYNRCYVGQEVTC